MKRVVVISDLHCGNRGGLTPPAWQYSHDAEDKDMHKFAHVQRQLWEWYSKKAAELQPIHALLINGDAIDGKGEKSGGTEQITLDRHKQTEIAEICIKEMKAEVIRMTYGSPYHTGIDEDWEDMVAKAVNALIGGDDNYDINGVIFNMKHFESRSVVPYGRFTPLMRDRMWNELLHLRQGYPKADVLLRSHAHYYLHAEDAYGKAFVTPSLELYTKFGTRRCSGDINVGLINFDIEENGVFSWTTHLMYLNGLVRPPEKL